MNMQIWMIVYSGIYVLICACICISILLIITHISICIILFIQPSMEDMTKTNLTPFQIMKNSVTKNKRNKELIRERNEFMNLTNRNRIVKEETERIAAIRIQGLFRGYHSRPKIPGNVLTKKKPVILTPRQLRTFLCDLTSLLNLKPIKGLTLKMREKSSRQQFRVDNASAFRIQAFFKMILARKLAKLRMIDINREREIFSMRVLKRSLGTYSCMC